MGSAPNEALIRAFYSAFQQRDAEGMIACYHPHIHFSDPVFVDLHGSEAGDMWRMLCERGEDLRVEFQDVRADDASGGAHWEAWYTFTGTGRKVHNRIDATFEFADGKISRHADHFDLRAWAGQALGLPGRLFGGLPFFQRKIRATAMRSLSSFRDRRP